MIHRHFADSTNQYSVATRLRRRRFEILVHIIEDVAAGAGAPVTILDIGGTQQYWDLMIAGSIDPQRLQVTLLNLEPQIVSRPMFASVVGDGRSMPQYADRQFDIVFSNSTIEHAGSFHEQACLANEVRRVGRHYCVQTPNRYFPIEPHFVFPFFQFLPLGMRVWLVQHFQLGWYPRIGDRQAAFREVSGIRLLNRRELQQLFRDASIYEEKFCGMVKSFVAHAGFKESR